MIKVVCSDCMSDLYLQNHFVGDDEDECSYCGQETRVMPLDEFADMCEAAILAAFKYVNQPPSFTVYEREPVGMSVHAILDQILGCSDELVDDVGEALLTLWSHWDDDDPYFLEGAFEAYEMSAEWDLMARSLHDEARFLNPAASMTLEKVFGSIDQLQIGGDTLPIFTIGPGEPIQSFQRARVFSDEKSMADALKHPELYLGPPPAGVGQSGRMNAKGVSVFYGATDEETAIAEVRPPVGSKVVTTTFNVIRPLRLLNLGGLSGIRPNQSLSYFDPARLEQAERCAFLVNLQSRLLMPVMPELAERDYLITQVIADFLSTHSRLDVDGLFFPSVQVSSRESTSLSHNIILFNKACGVLKSEAGFEAEHVSLWDADEDNFYFYPEIWAAPATSASASGAVSSDASARFQVGRDKYPPSLELDRNLIRIHEVKGVLFCTKSDSVQYHPSTLDPLA